MNQLRRERRCTCGWRRSSITALQLAEALEHEGEHDAARQALRGFLDTNIIPPGDGLLQVVGNFGEMLTAASGWNDRRWLLSVMVVAGARNPLDLELPVDRGRAARSLLTPRVVPRNATQGRNFTRRPPQSTQAVASG
jgi:hypothetical protein